MADNQTGGESPEERGLTRADWKRTVLSAMANYIDAGSILAGAVGLVVWVPAFGMSAALVGILAAISSNAISAGIGSLAGGRLCDLIGRKRIYQYDLLFYAFGTLWIVFAQNAWMLIVGYVIVGLAVGADIPASWTLIAEQSPGRHRGRLNGLAQVFWYVGTVVPLVLGLILAIPLGLLGVRIIWAHLFVAAMITWAFRQGMAESARWTEATRDSFTTGAPSSPEEQPDLAEVPSDPTSLSSMRQFLTWKTGGPLLFVTALYGVQNLAPGTYGFFFPYLLSEVGAASTAGTYIFEIVWLGTTVITLLAVFMPLVDRVPRRTLLSVGAGLQVVAFVPFVVFGLNNWTVVFNVLVFGFAAGIGQMPFFQVLSGELFPTLIRSTAQGIAFAVARVVLGAWSFLVPLILAAAGFVTLAAILTIFLFISFMIAVLFTPATEGKSLEEIQEELGNRARLRESTRGGSS